MKDRPQRPGRGQRQRDRDNEIAQNCHEGESQPRSKEPAAGGPSAAGTTPEAGLQGRSRGRRRTILCDVWGHEQRSAAKRWPIQT